MRKLSRILIAATALLSFIGGGDLWANPGASAAEARDIAGVIRLTQATPAIDPALLAPRKEGDDFIIGAANAQVVIIEYASLTCPHCARFHAEVLPKLKAEYVDTGLVKFIYRDFPLDRVALQAAQVARCLPAERYYSFLDVLFRQQEQWAAGKDPAEMIERVKQLGQLAGMPRDQSAACVADQAMQLKIVGAAQTGEKDYQIRATPTVVINGKRHAGANSFEDLDKVLRPLVQKP